MFLDADLSLDDFLGGRLRLWQPLRGYRAAADPVLLAACVTARPGQLVLDMGCGAGTAALCLAARVPGVVLTGLEFQAVYADLARRNAARNDLAMTVVDGDVADMPAELRIGFDHVIANPPYYAQGGSPSADPGRDLALRVQTPIGDWVAAGARRTKPGGWMTMIVATDLLPQALAALAGCGSTAVLPLAARAGKSAKRLILRTRKGGRGAFRLLPPLHLHSGDMHGMDHDSHTPEIRKVLRDGAGLGEKFA